MLKPPYTHQTHAARCRAAAQESIVFTQFVQTRTMQISSCARIRAAWTTNDGVDLWQLELLGPVKGIGSFRTTKTTQCSGLDGRCTCAGESKHFGPPAPEVEGSPLAGRGHEAALSASDLAATAAPAFCQAGVVAPPDSLNIEKSGLFAAGCI